MQTLEYVRLLTGDRDPDNPLLSESEYRSLLWRHRMRPSELREAGYAVDANGRAELELTPVNGGSSDAFSGVRGGWLDAGRVVLLDGEPVDGSVDPHTVHGAEGIVEFQSTRPADTEVTVRTHLGALRKAASAALLTVASDRARLARKVELEGLNADLKSAAEEVRRQARALAGVIGLTRGGPEC